jgi:hypothetical protein
VSFSWSLRLLVAHFFVTTALAGLIWTIQVVHYPLFDRVDRQRFVEFEQSHSSRISFLVGPLMGAELLLSGWLLFQRPTGVPLALSWVAFAVLMAVHATTVLCSVPAHSVLGRGFSETAHHRLVQTNWIRTAGWTVRAIIAGVMVIEFVTLRVPSI